MNAPEVSDIMVGKAGLIYFEIEGGIALIDGMSGQEQEFDFSVGQLLI